MDQIGPRAARAGRASRVVLVGLAIVATAITAFAMGTVAGAHMLGVEGGAIAAGQLADLVAIDLDEPSLHPRTDLLKSVVYAMSPRAVTDVWVHGRRVVERGRLALADQARLLARVRELTRGWSI